MATTFTLSDHGGLRSKPSTDSLNASLLGQVSFDPSNIFAQGLSSHRDLPGVTARHIQVKSAANAVIKVGVHDQKLIVLLPHRADQDLSRGTNDA
jgi:hypothetical protein